MQLGKQVSETVTIHNTSQHSSATWSLRVLPKHASITAASSSSVAAQQAECASGQANTALSSSETPAISITARGSGADAQHAQQAAAGSNADAQHAQPDAARSDADAQQDAAGLSASAQHAQQAAADSTADAQHAQQAAYQGIPAALQAKEQQLLQQLHDAQVAEHSATLTDAADSTSMSAAEGAVAPTLAQNPFEGIPADEAEQKRGCKVVIEPEFGTLAAGASATVQVSRSHCLGIACYFGTLNS